MMNFRAVRGLRQQPLLVCVSSSEFHYASAPDFLTRAAANVRRVIELWEAREAPLTAVRSHLDGEGDSLTGSEVFAIADLVFDSVRCSILRNNKFRSFHGDIGAPPIVMIGGGLESTIMASAIDAYWFNIPFTVIVDAVCPAQDLTETECATAVKLLTNFVDVVDMAFIEND